MIRVVEIAWACLLFAYAFWLIYPSYSVIPGAPCSWWAHIPPPERPPGLGRPQLALIAAFLAIFATISLALRDITNPATVFFIIMIPLITVTLPLMAVVSMEIYGGCVQLGGPELSRYNSFESLIVLLVFGGPIYALFAAVVSAIIFASIWFARRRRERTSE